MYYIESLAKMVDTAYIVCLLLVILVKLANSSNGLFDEDLYKRVLNNVTCDQHLQEINVMQFYDASGRVPQSVTLGGQGSLGNYRQCLSVVQKLPNDTINGKYCIIQVPLDTLNPPNFTPTNPEINGSLFELIRMVNATEIEESMLFKRTLRVMLGDGNIRAMSPPQSRLSVTLALCIPESCTTAEAIGQFTRLLNVTYQDEYCRLSNDKVFSAVDYIAVATIVIIGILTILSTGYDLYNCFVLRKDAAHSSKVLTCCSVYTNTHRLLTFSKAPGSIDCLDGIRALSILWVVVGHSFTNLFLNIVVNLLTAYQWAISSDAIWLLSAVLSVDTFFMMSGLLVVYTTVKNMTSKSLVRNVHWFYLHRLLRMFPLLAAVVLFQASLAHHSGDGPRWPVLAPGVLACRKWWWSALLHVQNYVNVTEMCLAHTWYLSVDTQLHVFSPLVLFWVLRGRRSAWCGLAAGLMVSLIGTAAYCYIKGFSGLSLLNAGTDVSQLMVYFKLYYVNTLTRSPAFLVGMVYGYLLHVWREHPRRIPKWFIATGWLTAFALGSGMIYFNYPGVKITDFWRNFLNAFMRPLWALSVGWAVFACSSGYGGPVNWFLSWTMWKYLARVSYALYLVHYPLQAAARGQGDVPVMFSVTSLFYTFYTDLALSLMAATFLCIVVDAPFSTLQKIFLTGKSAPLPPKGVSSSTQNFIVG